MRDLGVSINRFDERALAAKIDPQVPSRCYGIGLATLDDDPGGRPACHSCVASKALLVYDHRRSAAISGGPRPGVRLALVKNLGRSPDAQVRTPAKLLPVPPHDRGRWLQPDPDAASFVDVSALSGNAPDDILSGQYRCHLPPP
jgi:hypothetical protein